MLKINVNYLGFFLVFFINILFAQVSIDEILNTLQGFGISEEEAMQIYEDNINSKKSPSNNAFNSFNKDSTYKNVEKVIDSNQSVNDNPDSLYNKIDINNDNFFDNLAFEDSLDIEPTPLVDSLYKDELSIDKSQYFGYSTFRSNPSIFQNSADISVSPDYIIGPGDEIIIMLWGDTEDMSTYTVSRDGYIFILNIGQVFVNGLNLAGLEKKLKKVLQKAYSSISSDNKNSSTFFDVSLGSIVLKPIRVFVMGEVDQPGAYEMMPSTSLFTSLYYFDGPKISGSLRDVKLIRKGKEVTSIDFYDFLLTGKKLNDIKLQDNDVIFIPNRSLTVTVSGEVKRSSIFELKEEETFQDLKNIFGGYLSTTYMKRARIDRILSIEDRLKYGKGRKIIDINLNELITSENDLKIFDGDSLTFYPINDDPFRVVTIEGHVNRPGSYSMGSDLTVSQLIKKADGLINEDIFRDRIDIIRQLDDGRQKFISVNLDSALSNKVNHNIELISDDLVKIYSLSDRVYSEDVSIDGYVLDPGPKPFREGMTIFDLVFQGGGFEDINRINNTYLDRADLLRVQPNNLEFQILPFNLDSVLAGKGIAQNEVLMGDKITIYSKEQIKGAVDNQVEISGFIKFPGFYEYAENMKISDLLFKGAGVNDTSFYNQIFLGRADLIRFDNKTNKKRIISFELNDVLNQTNKDLKLYPGDKLIVYSKGLFEEFNSIVTIDGDVSSPGEYELYENMLLKDLILIAGGVSTFSKTIKIDIASKNNLSIDNKIKANIKSYFVKNDKNAYLDGSNGAMNYKLRPNDFIRIFSNELAEYESITIEGEIKFPGQYILETKEDKLTNLIKRAGGLTEYANPDASVLYRNNDTIKIDFSSLLKSSKSKYNIDLVSGDKIQINPRTNLVTLIGEVSSPGVYQYVRGKNLNDYIEMAGGFTSNANKLSAFVSYPNGRSKRKKLIGFSPSVLDGSVIKVLAKEETEPFSFTEYVTNLTKIYTDIIQAYALISILGQSSSD